MTTGNKTKPTSVSVKSFIDTVPVEQRRKDAKELVKIFEDITGFKPYMFGPSIIGFGNYHYTYATGREGDAPVAGFSPRKDSMVIYIESEFEGRKELLSKLGPHKTGKICLYIKKLDEVDVTVIRKLVLLSMEKTRSIYPVSA